jgi:hypothetical protein
MALSAMIMDTEGSGRLGSRQSPAGDWRLLSRPHGSLLADGRNPGDRTHREHLGPAARTAASAHHAACGRSPRRGESGTRCSRVDTADDQDRYRCRTRVRRMSASLVTVEIEPHRSYARGRHTGVGAANRPYIRVRTIVLIIPARRRCLNRARYPSSPP